MVYIYIYGGIIHVESGVILKSALQYSNECVGEEITSDSSTFQIALTSPSGLFKIITYLILAFSIYVLVRYILLLKILFKRKGVTFFSDVKSLVIITQIVSSVLYAYMYIY